MIDAVFTQYARDKFMVRPHSYFKGIHCVYLVHTNVEVHIGSFPSEDAVLSFADMASESGMGEANFAESVLDQ